MKNLLVILPLMFTLLFLSSCAVTQNVGGRKEILSAKSLSTMKPGRHYTFYNKNGLIDRIKVLKVDSAIVYGKYQGKGNVSFEKTFEEIINEMERVTTVSGGGIAGNVIIAGAMIMAAIAAIGLTAYLVFFSWWL